MWPQTATRGCFSSIASRIARLPRWSPLAAGVAVAVGRGVEDQQVESLGAILQSLGRLLLVEVEAPVPWGGRDAGAEAEELHLVLPGHAGTVQNHGRELRVGHRAGQRRLPFRCYRGSPPVLPPSRPRRRGSPPSRRESRRSRRRRQRGRRRSDRSTRSAQASRSRWRSLKARTFIRESAQSSSMRRARASVSSSSSVSVTTLSRPRRAVRASITSSTSTSRSNSAATLPEVAGSQSSSRAS